MREGARPEVIIFIAYAAANKNGTRMVKITSRPFSCSSCAVPGGGILFGQGIGGGGDERRGDSENEAGRAENVLAGEAVKLFSFFFCLFVRSLAILFSLPARGGHVIQERRFGQSDPRKCNLHAACAG